MSKSLKDQHGNDPLNDDVTGDRMEIGEEQAGESSNHRKSDEFHQWKQTTKHAENYTPESSFLNVLSGRNCSYVDKTSTSTHSSCSTSGSTFYQIGSTRDEDNYRTDFHSNPPALCGCIGNEEISNPFYLPDHHVMDCRSAGRSSFSIKNKPNLLKRSIQNDLLIKDHSTQTKLFKISPHKNHSEVSTNVEPLPAKEGTGNSPIQNPKPDIWPQEEQKIASTSEIGNAAQSFAEHMPCSSRGNSLAESDQGHKSAAVEKIFNYLSTLNSELELEKCNASKCVAVRESCNDAAFLDEKAGDHIATSQIELSCQRNDDEMIVLSRDSQAYIHGAASHFVSNPFEKDRMSSDSSCANVALEASSMVSRSEHALDLSLSVNDMVPKDSTVASFHSHTGLKTLSNLPSEESPESSSSCNERVVQIDNTVPCSSTSSDREVAKLARSSAERKPRKSSIPSETPQNTSSSSSSAADTFYMCKPTPSATARKFAGADDSYCECAKRSRDTGCDIKCTCGEEDSVFDWTWDHAVMSKPSDLSPNGRNVRFHVNYSSGTAAVRGTMPMKEGQHFWEIKMTTPVYGTDMMIGVGVCDLPLDTYKNKFCSMLGMDSMTWGLSYFGRLHHKNATQLYSSKFGQGTIIGVHLDMWRGLLSFYKNKKPLGVAYCGLKGKTLCPMASSTAARSGMRIIKACSFQTSLQFMCCQALRRLVPPHLDVLESLNNVPPGLRDFLENNLRWLLRPTELSPLEIAMMKNKEKGSDDSDN